MFVVLLVFGNVEFVSVYWMFQEVQVICVWDVGVFWGCDLCGLMLLVDLVDCSVVVNQFDVQGMFKLLGQVFVGMLLMMVILVNIVIEWFGICWSEIFWFLFEDMDQWYVMFVYEMFYCIQLVLKMVLREGDNWYLDMLQGCYLMQLEWCVLVVVLCVLDMVMCKIVIGDVLLFCCECYCLFLMVVSNENDLELNEGIVEYIGVWLGLIMLQVCICYVLCDLMVFVKVLSFVCLFVYVIGLVYGLLLDQIVFGWCCQFGFGQWLDQLLGNVVYLLLFVFVMFKV